MIEGVALLAGNHGISTKQLFVHKVKEHLPGVVSRTYKVSDPDNSFPLDRVFEQSWKKVIDLNCEFERNFYSEVDPEAHSELLSWLRGKSYANLGKDREVVDRAITLGLQRAHALFLKQQDRIQKKAQELQALQAQNKLDEIRKAKEEERRWKKQKELFLQKCSDVLTTSYEEFEDLEAEAFDLGISNSEFTSIRNEYVRKFLTESGIGKGPDSIIRNLDDEQLWAIGEPSATTALITARAGSGKTTVLALRAVFIIKRFDVDPCGIVMLAFNKAAALELKIRISRYLIHGAGLELPEIAQIEQGRYFNAAENEARILEEYLSRINLSIPLVTTFHALAYAVVNSGANEFSEYLTNVIVDENTERTQRTDRINQATSRVIQGGIQARFRKMMIEHFETDWIELLRVQGLDAKSPLSSDYLKYPRDTLQGHSVRSHGEKTIADFLFKRGINYWYEKPIAQQNSVTRPDFEITSPRGSKLIIEYFGLEGDTHYDQNTKIKLARYTSQNIQVLSLYPRDIPSGRFAEKATNFLKANGFSEQDLEELPVEILWAKIEVRGRRSFNSAISSFIDRANQLSLTPQDISQRLPSGLHGQSLGGNILTFSHLAVKIYEEYLRILSENQETDFYQVLRNATNLLSSGTHLVYRSEVQRDLTKITHLFVDEFQDFSQLFKHFIDSLIAVGEEPSFVAVGDPWQSINSFMGSDGSILEAFTETYAHSKELSLLKNHRSAKEIVELGNIVMQGQAGHASIPANTSIATIKWVTDELFEQTQAEDDAIGNVELAKLVRLVHQLLNAADRVTVLTRTNSVTGAGGSETNSITLLEQLRPFLGEDQLSRVQHSTVHSYKGKESDAVILWKANDNKYPLVHSNWVFNQFFGVTREDIVQEEQRLFYVAVTRAKSFLIINTDDSPSPFFQQSQIRPVQWPLSSLASNLGTEIFRFQVFLSGKDEELEMRGILKGGEKKFIFKNIAGQKYWELKGNAKDFSLDRLAPEVWIQSLWKSLIPLDPPQGSSIKLEYKNQTVHWSNT